MIGVAVGALAGLLLAAPAAAHHATPIAEVTTGDCGEVTITTTWGADEHQVDTAALVVLVDGEVHTAPIGEPITVGPFEADTTVQWRVWGGGEREYDDPPLTDLEALLAYLDQGGSELAPDAPGVAWHSLEVTGCPADEEEEDLEPTPEPTPTTPPADDDDDAGGAGGGDDDTLPVTGSTTVLLGGGAVLLLGLGAGVYLAARRRRVSFSA